MMARSRRRRREQRPRARRRAAVVRRQHHAQSRRLEARRDRGFRRRLRCRRSAASTPRRCAPRPPPSRRSCTRWRSHSGGSGFQATHLRVAEPDAVAALHACATTRRRGAAASLSSPQQRLGRHRHALPDFAAAASRATIDGRAADMVGIAMRGHDVRHPVHAGRPHRRARPRAARRRSSPRLPPPASTSRACPDGKRTSVAAPCPTSMNVATTDAVSAEPQWRAQDDPSAARHDRDERRTARATPPSPATSAGRAADAPPRTSRTRRHSRPP